MSVRRTAAAAALPVILPLVLLLAACSDGGGEPDRPAYAEQTGRAGAERFAGYWVDTLEKASLTGKTKELRSLSLPRCDTCSGFAEQIDTIYGDGGSVKTAGFELEQVVPERGATEDEFGLLVTLVVEPQTVVRSKGAKPEEFTGGERRYRMVLVPNDDGGGWVIARLSAR